MPSRRGDARRSDRDWQHDPWDDPDVTDALVIERPRALARSIKWLVYARRCSWRSSA